MGANTHVYSQNLMDRNISGLQYSHNLFIIYNLNSHLFCYRIIREVLGDGLVTLNGAEHATHRRLISPSFNNASIKCIYIHRISFLSMKSHSMHPSFLILRRSMENLYYRKVYNHNGICVIEPEIGSRDLDKLYCIL